ncbi:MAG: c-type cytochrome domain-containing protein [Luteolibacter sp.]
MPRITITPPGKKAQPYIFKPDRENVQIGRGSSNDIIIDCASISTLHAELVRVDGEYELRDLGSTNGIKKDGKRHDIIPLADGDTLMLGDVEFTFNLSTEKPPAPEVDPEPDAEPATTDGPATTKETPGLTGPVIFAILGIAAVLYAAFGIEQRTGEVNEWYLFLGRFHPLAVHLPIGLLVIAAVFDWLGVIRPLAHLRRAVPALLVAACIGALLAVYHGVLLAAGSGVLLDTVESHLWAGVYLTIAMFLLIPVRAFIARAPGFLTGTCYQGLLVVSLFLLMGASHLGGNITHGREYLIEYMPEPMRESLVKLPAPIREFIGFPAPAEPISVADLTLYDAVFAGPINQYCVACHKPDRVRGGLLMHTFEAILEGGESGPAIVHGDLEASELFTRITLPKDDEFHMPPDGRKGFSDTQIAWFEWWISSGIPGDTLAVDVKDAPAEILAAIQDAIATSGLPADESAEPTESLPSWNPDELAAVNAALSSGRIVPISRNPADGLLLTTAGAGESFTDADLETIAPLAPFMVEADLSRTGVTDGGMATVASWPGLRRLRVDHTAIGDSGVRALTDLAELASLNLFNTRITHASVETLLAMPSLAAVFAGETSLDDDALARLADLLPEIPSPPTSAAEPEPSGVE